MYDLGGGTFDVSVVRREAQGFSPPAHRGIDDFGGVDLDALVVEQIGVTAKSADPGTWKRLTEPRTPSDRRHFRTLWDDARSAKESLSRRSQVQGFVPIAERDALVSREAFEQAARPSLGRTVEVTMATIREAQVRPPDIVGVFLVGGSTRVPLVATMLHQGLGVAPTVIEQPEVVVAEGALTATAPAPASTREAPVPSITPPVSLAPQRRSAPGKQPSAFGSRIAPLVGAVVGGIGFLILLLAPWAALGDDTWQLVPAGGTIGSLLFMLGSVGAWFWPGLTVPLRLTLPGGFLLQLLFWTGITVASPRDRGEGRVVPEAVGRVVLGGQDMRVGVGEVRCHRADAGTSQDFEVEPGGGQYGARAWGNSATVAP